VRWPDNSFAAGVSIAIYPQGYSPPGSTHVAKANIGTGSGGHYVTAICSKTACEHVQAFLELPVDTVFPDGCTLPLATSFGPASGFATTGGTVDWTIADGTCTSDPSGTPIDDANVPAFTTDYVEQRINSVGGGTLASTDQSTTTTTLAPR
jgi:hypothetical protein